MFKNSESYRIYKDGYYNTDEVAVLAVGLWDSHNCKVASDILDILSPKADNFFKKCRTYNIPIIFGSSSLTSKPQYQHLKKNLKNIPFQNFVDHGLNFPPLPFDDSDGGVVEKNPNFNRKNVGMHPSIEICDQDIMSGNNKEILKKKKDRNLLQKKSLYQ